MILKWRFFWNARILREYDIVIFSGDCLGAMRHVRGDAQKIYYCHTPPRYLYDFRDQYLAGLSPFFRPLFRVVFDFFARVYERNIRKFDIIFSNSENVKKRLLHYTNTTSTIIYPPTDTSFFTPSADRTSHELPFPSSEYFYSWARLSPPKRVDMIVDAFLAMPDKNLIFSYGKNDPMRGSILAKIQNAPNIRAIEAPDDILLLSLIRGARATIYIPVDEDFGMTPVESMACGVPVI
ncbi:MAG: glycosyltransferase [Patescibacteria group bacterium]